MFNSSSQKQLTDLQVRFDAVTEQLTQSEATRAELQRQLTDLQGKADGLNTKLGTIKAEHAAEIARLNQAHADSIEAEVSTLVIDRCASAGVEPIRRVADATATEFQGLTGLAKARAIFAANQSA